MSPNFFHFSERLKASTTYPSIITAEYYTGISKSTSTKLYETKPTSKQMYETKSTNKQMFETKSTSMQMFETISTSKQMFETKSTPKQMYETKSTTKQMFETTEIPLEHRQATEETTGTIYPTHPTGGLSESTQIHPTTDPTIKGSQKDKIKDVVPATSDQTYPVMTGYFTTPRGKYLTQILTGVSTRTTTERPKTTTERPRKIKGIGVLLTTIVAREKDTTVYDTTVEEYGIVDVSATPDDPHGEDEVTKHPQRKHPKYKPSERESKQTDLLDSQLNIGKLQ